MALFGFFGGCRRDELYNLSFDHITEEGEILVVRFPASYTKTSRKRMFTVISEGIVDYVALYKKYISLRPKNVPHRHVFVYYNNMKCTRQRVGINTFGKIPKEIAKYLGINESDLFTGHCFRRTSATTLANTGADSTTLKRHYGWTSDKVALGYVEDSVPDRIKISRSLATASDSSVGVPNFHVEQSPRPGSSMQNVSVSMDSQMNVNASLLPHTFQSCQFSNCTLNFAVTK